MRKNKNIQCKSARFALLCFATGPLLSACGGGGGGSGGTTTPPPATYSVAASVSGLSGSGLTLTFNNGSPIAVSASGTVVLATSLANTSSYSVAVATGPTSAQECLVSNGSGSISGANVDIKVTCAAPTSLTMTQAASGTVVSSAGGTITVSGQGPLSGAQIVVPPNALGDPSDTLTINYSNTLPAPIDAAAVTAGAIPVAKTISLSRTGTTRFVAALTVTIPYFTSVLGPTDYPVVLYWDPSLGTYHAMQVTDVDRTAGTISFVTKHFSSFIAVGINGLSNMLQGSASFTLSTSDTNFRPETDGFEIENLSTQYTDLSNNGVCWGMTSYAAWYFTAKYKSQNLTRLFSKYSAPGLAGNPHIPQQDRVARELVHETWIDTLSENNAPAPIGSTPSISADASTASELVLALQLTHAPQMVTLSHSLISGGHSVLVYAWSTDPAFGPFALKFSVYDPNYPNVEVDPIRWTPATGFQAYQATSTDTSWGVITFDAWSSHYDPALLGIDFDSAEQGWPSPSFDTTSITMPTAATPPSYPSPGTYQVPAAGASFSVKWNCISPPANATGVVDKCGSSYLHAFLNSEPIGVTQAIQPGQTVPISIPPLTTLSAELLVIISTQPTISPDQVYISIGYDSFLRALLVPAGSTAGTCIPPAGATTCTVTLYDIPDSTHSGFSAPAPGTITTVQTNNGVTTTSVNNLNPLGVTIYDNVNGPPLNAPICNYEPAVGCPSLNYHHFQVCAVDGKYTPVSYNSVVSDQVPLLSNSGCTGAPNVNNIITGYTLSADGILTGTDTSTASQNLTCTVPYVSGPGTYTTTATLQNAKDDPISMNLKDGSGNASVSETRRSNSTNSLDPSQNQTSTTSVTGTQSWPAESVSPPQFPNTGIVASTTSVPEGQSLPQACTVGTP